MSTDHKEVYDIETLMRTYGDDVLRTAYMYVKDIHTAEDMFQEVFVKVNNKLDTFCGNSSIKTWIIRITINTCKDYLKSSWNQKVTTVEDYHENILHVEEDYKKVEQEEESLAIRKSIMELPEKYKEVVLYVYYHELSIAEVAKQLNIAEGTVKSRLSRAKEKLSKSLGGREKYGW